MRSKVLERMYHGMGYVTAMEAAKHLRVSEGALAKLRMRGRGPVYSKNGAPDDKKAEALYMVEDLDRWLWKGIAMDGRAPRNISREAMRAERERAERIVESMDESGEGVE